MTVAPPLFWYSEKSLEGMNMFMFDLFVEATHAADQVHR